MTYLIMNEGTVVSETMLPSCLVKEGADEASLAAQKLRAYGPVKVYKLVEVGHYSEQKPKR